MTQVHLLGAGKTYDTAKQAVVKNQIVHINGYENDKYVVYDIVNGYGGLIYKLVNLRTHRFSQCDLIRPLSEKFGIGYYYDDANPEFMDYFEVFVLQQEAGRIEQQEKDDYRKNHEHENRLKAIGRQRLEAIVPSDAKAAVIAELREDESDTMSDYFDYRTKRTVILGFSGHTKDLFAEMRKYAANFPETASLSEENRNCEHREKYTGGDGYYLGESKYSGWIIKKEKFSLKAQFIERYALAASDENNICIKAVKTDAETLTVDFQIVDYSEKALAVFGDTKPIKDRLKKLGGRFNPNLNHEGEKKAGWIFAKNREQAVRNLLATGTDS
jgi:hypothetical protein